MVVDMHRRQSPQSTENTEYAWKLTEKEMKLVRIELIHHNVNAWKNTYIVTDYMRFCVILAAKSKMLHYV